MPRRPRANLGHSGQTDRGNTRDLKIERVGPVTIYKRGLTYYLYYREAGTSRRRRVQGNLAVARATASKVASALAERRPSPLEFRRATPRQLIDEFLDYNAHVQGLALRTQDRYRAALDRFLDFCTESNIAALQDVDERTVEAFVKWLRGQTRTRNGASKGKRAPYKIGGVKFVLSTCRTAFNWANRRRMLPPYSTNPFAVFPIDQLRDRDDDGHAGRVFSPAQEQAFFRACTEWQSGIFRMLATYGLRVGELTHLLIEDVDFEAGTIAIRSKPELFWTVKTGRRRLLPLVPQTRTLLERVIGARKAGFVFLNEPHVTGKCQPVSTFPTPRSLQMHLQRLVIQLVSEKADATQREKRRHVVAFCRSIGQIPEKRVRDEFMKLTCAIGCPELTRAHDLRHLFSSRAQEAGLNPLLVQEMLGHTTLEMTRRYTHLGVETKRAALESLHQNHPRALAESEE